MAPGWETQSYVQFLVQRNINDMANGPPDLKSDGFYG